MEFNWAELSKGEKTGVVVVSAIVVLGVIFLVAKPSTASAKTPSNPLTGKTTVIDENAKVNWILENYGYNQALADALANGMSADEVDAYYQYLQLKNTGGNIPQQLNGYIQSENNYYGIESI